MSASERIVPLNAQTLSLFADDFDVLDNPDDTTPFDRASFLNDSAAFASCWIEEKHGSAAEFIEAVIGEFGPGACIEIFDVVDLLRQDGTAPASFQEYVKHTLSRPALEEALGAKPEKRDQDIASLDELFARSSELRSSAKFAEAVDFVSRFRRYSPFNNMLVYVQNSGAIFWALASHWKKEFGRNVKDDARSMIILAPMTPVLLVYDVEDTEGEPLPEWFNEPFAVVGSFSRKVLEQTIANCERDCIEIADRRMNDSQAGYAQRVEPVAIYKMQIRLNRKLDDRAAYATLVHEMAHIYLGHLGSDRDGWWPARLSLNHTQRELEAEAVSYIVCRRAGLTTKSSQYLAAFISDPADLERISIDLITKVAGFIEQAGIVKLPPRKPVADSAIKP